MFEIENGVASSMTPHEAFELETQARINALTHDESIHALSKTWVEELLRRNYTYNFRWLGRPIIQLPQDALALQELIWRVKPDLIVETGIAHGGSLILSASLLTLIECCEAIQLEGVFDPRSARRRVLGVDIEIRPHNRQALAAHPLSHCIELIEGSSVAPEVVARVKAYARGFQRIFVCLDSNHCEAHVLAELEAYTPLVSKGSYCVVLDTVIEDLPDSLFSNRPWGRANNPKTAVRRFLRNTDRFVIDAEMENKLLATCAPNGFLKCVKD